MKIKQCFNTHQAAHVKITKYSILPTVYWEGHYVRLASTFHFPQIVKCI